MSVMNYIANQKRRILLRHTGDEEVSFNGESYSLFRSSAEILAELNSMEGLNERERNRTGSREYDPHNFSRRFAV